MYARVNKLDYFYTECIYAPNAYRGYARFVIGDLNWERGLHIFTARMNRVFRSFIKNLERIRPRAILDIIKSGEGLQVKSEIAVPLLGHCERYGPVSKV